MQRQESAVWGPIHPRNLPRLRTQPAGDLDAFIPMEAHVKAMPCHLPGRACTSCAVAAADDERRQRRVHPAPEEGPGVLGWTAGDLNA